jgi:hypothetical protein
MEFELTIPVFGGAKTFRALDRAVTVLLLPSTLLAEEMYKTELK